MDGETLRKGFVTGLRAEAERRFGAARAGAITQTIEDTARWMAEIATFPVDVDDAPAFYAEPGS